jgi:hypothetical protein
MYNNNYENLKNEVMEMLENMAIDSNLETVINEVLQYGCVSGIVGNLVYYYQTEEFFDRHKDAINDLAHELSEEIYDNPFEIYHNLNGGCSKNNMAWFGFEEVTRIIANEMEMDF